MKKLSLLFVSSLVAVTSAYACGGGEPAKDPNGASSAIPSASAAPSATANIAPTATATETAPAPPPAPEAPPLAIDGIKITGKTKAGKPIGIDVNADGSVTGMKDGKSTVIASFVKNELKDEKGQTVFSVAADGKVTSPLLSGAMSFNEKDDLIVDGKPAIAIADDGTPSFIHEGGKAEKVPFKFEKLPAKSKRAASILTAFLFVTTRTSATVSTPASASPKALPAPAPSAPKK